MENIQEKKEMTAQQSLNIISEMINDSRRTILQSSAKHFILWGSLLILVSLVVYWLWQSSVSPVWNVVWFVMPALGFPIVRILDRKDSDIPQSKINMNIGLIWLTYCIFAVCISVIAMLWVHTINITLVLVVIFGFAQCVSGFILKNWAIIVSGFILGIGGAVAASLLFGAEQLLIFTIGGIMLVVTGLIIKSQYK